MTARVHTFKEAEKRLNQSVASALNSTLALYMALVGVIILGLVLARN